MTDLTETDIEKRIRRLEQLAWRNESRMETPTEFGYPFTMQNNAGETVIDGDYLDPDSVHQTLEREWEWKNGIYNTDFAYAEAWSENRVLACSNNGTDGGTLHVYDIADDGSETEVHTMNTTLDQNYLVVVPEIGFFFMGPGVFELHDDGTITKHTELSNNVSFGQYTTFSDDLSPNKVVFGTDQANNQMVMVDMTDPSNASIFQNSDYALPQSPWGTYVDDDRGIVVHRLEHDTIWATQNPDNGYNYPWMYVGGYVDGVPAAARDAFSVSGSRQGDLRVGVGASYVNVYRPA